MHGHRFLDTEWTYICAESKDGWSNGRWCVHWPAQTDPMYCPQIPFVPAPPLAALSRLPVNSGVAVFSAGRLGCIGRSKCGLACESTSDTAIGAMFDAAKYSIQLALQDMGPIIDTGVPLNWWLFGHRWVMIALCKALVRGVTVSIIQSGLQAMDSYGV